MGVSWRIADDIVLLESSEDATFPEWRAAVDAFVAHPDYRPGMGVVHDWRPLRRVPPTAEIEARAKYARENASSFGLARWALVVSGLASYGMGRMAEALTDDSPVHLRVFRDLDEAKSWVRKTVAVVGPACLAATEMILR